MEGVHEECQAYFERYIEKTGQAPGRNFMMGSKELAHIPTHAVMRSWQALMGRRKPPRGSARVFKKETVMVEATTLENSGQTDEAVEGTTEGHITDLAVGLARQHRAHVDLVGEVRELRELIMQLPTKALPTPAELVQAMGRAQADIARLSTQQQRLFDRVDELVALVQALRQTLDPWRQFWQMLCTNDDCWESWQSMLRACSHHTKKTLLRFFADSAGRELSHNDRVAQ